MEHDAPFIGRIMLIGQACCRLDRYKFANRQLVDITTSDTSAEATSVTSVPERRSDLHACRGDCCFGLGDTGDNRDFVPQRRNENAALGLNSRLMAWVKRVI